MKAVIKSTRILILANKKKASFAGGAIGILSDISFPGEMIVLTIAGILLVVCLISGLITFNFFKQMDGSSTDEDLIEVVSKSQTSTIFVASFVSFAIVLGIYSIQKLTDSQDKGVLASFIPAVEKIQGSLFSINKNTENMSHSLDAIKEHTKKMVNKYEMSELEVLVKNKQWKSLLDHINDIDPRLRGERWMSILSKAGANQLENIYVLEEDSQKALEEFKSIVRSHPILRDSEEFMKVGEKITIEWATDCYRKRQGGCPEKIKRHLRMYKEGPELFLKLGKELRFFVYPHYTVRYLVNAFRRGLSLKSCFDPYVLEASKNAFVNLSAGHIDHDSALEIKNNFCTNLTLDSK